MLPADLRAALLLPLLLAWLQLLLVPILVAQSVSPQHFVD